MKDFLTINISKITFDKRRKMLNSFSGKRAHLIFLIFTEGKQAQYSFSYLFDKINLTPLITDEKSLILK
jgi:hypothetical protein